MSQPIEDLADFVKRVRKRQGYSLRDVENRSDKRISRGYVNQIENRSVLGQGVSPGRLVALAIGLGVSEDEVFAAARGKPLTEVEAMEAQLLVMLSQLPRDRQNDVLRLVRALHRAHAVKSTAVMEKRKSKSSRAA